MPPALRIHPREAWPTAEIAVMGPKAAVEILFRREIAAVRDPLAVTTELEHRYRTQFTRAYDAAARDYVDRDYVDDVTDPRQTRPRLINALAMLRHKRDANPPGKHGNPSL